MFTVASAWGPDAPTPSIRLRTITHSDVAETTAAAHNRQAKGVFKTNTSLYLVYTHI
jgi:hypothetical protein